MKQSFKHVIITIAGILTTLNVVAKSSESAQVRQMIDKVNQYWQVHNSPETRAFWDHAAYHTGNMEAYFLTGNEDYLLYSETWANHNQWKGAKNDNRSEWKYSYGETDNHVLFGDWQICFQTYIDLYNILPEDKRIKRAVEVMEYQMSTPHKDYWWWADGLYMVMPVMTKLYKHTNNQKYLDKLYEYLVYADSIMFDENENLYYRDAKYVYPKHKTTNGKKDFWARGDGWVLAGLAKVLRDMPAGYVHYGFFVDKFRKMAKAVVTLQRPEGTFPAFGRSIPYRMATMQPLALLAWYQQLPEGLTNGQVRAALTAVMHNMFDDKENFNDGGFLTIGFAGRQPNIADWYTNNGSLYMTSLAFMPLGLATSHPFWTDAAQPWTNCKAWKGKPFPKDHFWGDKIRTWDLF